MFSRIINLVALLSFTLPAQAVLDRAYAVRDRALGPRHRDTASLLITIGNVHVASGEYGLALDAYQRAHDVLEAVAGPYHSLTLLTLLGTARSYAAQGDVAHAVEYQTRVDQVLERSYVAQCAYELGLCARALQLTARFASERKQFGRPIGTFQAVAQRIADAHVAVESMRLVLWRAAWLIEPRLG